MAEHPRPQFWSHGYPQGHYVQQHPHAQPQMQPSFHGPLEAGPHYFARMPPPPFAPQQQLHMYSRGQEAYGQGGYRPWGSPGFAPPQYGGQLLAPAGLLVRPASTGFASQMTRPDFGRAKELPGDPRPVLASSTTRGNGQLLKESPDLLQVRLGDGDREGDGDVSMDPVSVNAVDLSSIMTDVQGLILRAEKVVLQALQSLQLVSPTKLPKLVTCPSDSRHRVPPGSLFEHIFRCPSSPLIVLKDSYSVLSEVRYRSTEGQAKSLPVVKSEGGDSGGSGALMISSQGFDGEKFAGAHPTKNQPFDPWGGHFLYEDAPAVVQCAELSMSKKHQDIMTVLPGFLAVELGPENYSNEGKTTHGEAAPDSDGQAESQSKTPTSVSNNGQPGSILPSSFWALKKEVEAWKDFPGSYSAVVAKVLKGLGIVTRGEVIEWLLMNSPYYGVVLDMAIAKQVSYLVILCLRAIRRESLGYLQKTSEQFSSGIFQASGNWLALHLKILYSEDSARSLALAACKHSVLCAGRMLVSSFVRPGLWDKQEEVQMYANADQKLEILDEPSINQRVSQQEKSVSGDAPNDTAEEKIDHGRSDVCTSLGTMSQNFRVSGEEYRSILEDDILPWRLETAVVGMQERAALDQCLGVMMTSEVHSTELLQDHESVVSRAAAERRKRPHMRAVLEHDGLVWNRNQRQDEKKNKSKEELLAEERDYKRRRMSYRGKKVKRSPTQVLHDIIEGHMQEIASAGGIGCFIKDGKGDELVGSDSVGARESMTDLLPKNEQAQFIRQEDFIVRSGRGDVGTKSPALSSQGKEREAHRDPRFGHQRKHVQEHRGSDRNAHEVGSSRFEHHHTGDRYCMEESRSSEQYRRTAPVECLAGPQRMCSNSGGKEDRWEGSLDGSMNHQYQESKRSRSSERYRSR